MTALVSSLNFFLKSSFTRSVCFSSCIGLLELLDSHYRARQWIVHISNARIGVSWDVLPTA